MSVVYRFFMPIIGFLTVVGAILLTPTPFNKFSSNHKALKSVSSYAKSWSLQFPKLKANMPNDPAQLAQSLYYYIVGPPASGYPNGFEGPEKGLFGIVDELMGHSSVQQSLIFNEILSCEELPTEGSITVLGHPLGLLEMNFSPGRQRIPNHYTANPNSRFTHRIDLTRDGAFMLTMETSCSDDGIGSGYILIDDSRHMEIFFQLDRNGNRRQADVYMDFNKEDGNSFDERFVMRFESADGEDYQIWAVRNTQNIDADADSPDNDSVGVAVHGNMSNSIAQVEIVTDVAGEPDDVTPVSEGNPYCVNFSSGTTVAGIGSCDQNLQVNPAVTGVKGDNFTIGGSQRVSLQNTDVLLPSRSIHEFTDVVGGREGREFFTLTNSGTQSINNITPNILVHPFEFTGGNFPGLGGDCNRTIEPGESCLLDLSFTPIEPGSFATFVRLNYDYGTETRELVIDLLGTTGGATPTAFLSAITSTPFNFGVIPVGAAVTTRIVLENLGKGTANNFDNVQLAAPFSFTGGEFPGLGGTCTAAIAPGRHCSIEVVFQPTLAGVNASSLIFTYDNGHSGGLFQLDIVGSGSSVASLAISESDPYSFGSTTVGSFVQHVFTITNNGGSFAFFLNGFLEFGQSNDPSSRQFGFVGGTYPGVGGNCGKSLAPGASCEVFIQFSPMSIGVHTDVFNVTYSVDGTPSSSVVATRYLEGTGGAPALLTISETDPYDFGNTTIGAGVTYSFVVTNVGGADALNLAGAFSPPIPFQFTGGTFPGANGSCGLTLLAGNSCDVEVEFLPSTSGFFSSQLAIAYSDGLNNQISTRLVEGNAGTTALLSLDQSDPYNFGDVAIGSSPNVTFTLSNVGGGDASQIAGSLSAPFSFSGGAFPGIAGTCSATLATGSTCTLDIEVTPVAVGLVADSLTLDYNDGAFSRALSHTLTATAVQPSILSISDGSIYDFGNVPVGSTGTHALQVQNVGSFDATNMVAMALSAPFSYEGGTYPGTNGTCGATLAAGAGCSIVVSVSPVALGLAIDNVTLNYFDGLLAQSVTLDLHATGVASALLAISDADPYDFGTQAVGSILTHQFVVTNAGGGVATNIVENGLDSTFSFTGGTFPGAMGTCASSLDPGDNCILEVQSAPAAVGVFVGNLSLSYSDGSSTQTASRSLVSTSESPSFLTISGPSPYDFGNISVGGVVNYIVTLTNLGNLTATTISGVGLAAPFDFSGGFGYPGTGGTCGVNLSPGVSCDLEIEFIPSATGFFTDRLEVNYFDGVSNQATNLDLEGIGI